MRYILITLLFVFLQFPGRANSSGIPTDFEFSGTLLVGGKPAKGSFDLEFLAYRTPVGGDPLGTTATLDGVKLKKGVYSGRLDFGVGVFTGEPVWIEVRYQKLGKAPVPFETSPDRIAVGAVPHAMAAEHATTADFATTATFAALVNYAESSGDAATATFASGAGHAATADNATTATHALSAFARSGAAYEVVLTTDDPMQNGANLLAAYDRAKALAPHSAPSSATNRVTVLVPPARYDMETGQLVMNTEFVDIVGLSTNRENQYIYGLSNGNNTGVLRQTANNVRIENLKVHCTRTGGLIFNSSHPAAYFPDGDKAQTSITNCSFSASSGAWSMRYGIAYSGHHTECTGESHAFGGGGIASGTFTNCTGGVFAFGGGVSGAASGTFTNCIGGNSAFGGNGTASGTFTNCTGLDGAFGGLGTASGTFTNCTGGIYAFGGFASADGGRFCYCRGGAGSFGPNHAVRLFCIQNDVALP